MNQQYGSHLHGMNEGQLDHWTNENLNPTNQLDDHDAPNSTRRSSTKSLSANGSDQALHILNELRELNLLCDAQISVEGQSFNVHRAIMSSCSPYFRARFTGFNNEGGLVHIPGISAAIMNAIIQYAYVRKSIINDDNVHELLTCADYMGIVGLVKQCKDYLARSLNAMNCISIMGFARFRFIEDLYAKARNYTLRYFTDVATRNTDIMELKINDFYNIISDDELNTREEDFVWRMCVKWIDHDVESRLKHVAHLMTGVRLGLMTPKCFVEEVKENPYVIQCKEAKPLLIDTFKFLYDLDFLNQESEELVTPALGMPRVPHEVIFAIGGWSGGASKGCIETYDTRADRWVKINAEDPAGPRAYHGTAVIGFKIYSIGGYDGVEYFNTCRVFDAAKKRWSEIAPMHSRRCYVSVAELNGLIYAIGGYDGHNRLNTVERYNPRTNQWTIIAPMHIQRSDASACTLHGRIYATGGFNGQECLDSAEFFDPYINVWTRIPNMHHRRSGVSCVAFKDQIYVIGGFNGTTRLSTGERFDPETQNWHFIRQMNHSRSNFGLEIIDDMIFAIGGFNGVSTICHTECYVIESDEWMEATDMNIVRSALTANTIAGLPNKRDYIHKERDRLVEERRQRLMATAMGSDHMGSVIRQQSLMDGLELFDLDEDEGNATDVEILDEEDVQQLPQPLALPPPAILPAAVAAAAAPPPSTAEAAADADAEADPAAQQAATDDNNNAANSNNSNTNNRRFRVQLRNQRFSSHHEMRRRS